MWLKAIALNLDSGKLNPVISPTRNSRIITQSLKKKGNCFVCGKLGHHAVTNYKRRKKTKENPSKANLVKGEGIVTVVVVPKVNVVTGNNDWVVDFSATNYICDDKSVLYDYESMIEGEE